MHEVLSRFPYPIILFFVLWAFTCFTYLMHKYFNKFNFLFKHIDSSKNNNSYNHMDLEEINKRMRLDDEQKNLMQINEFNIKANEQYIKENEQDMKEMERQSMERQLKDSMNKLNDDLNDLNNFINNDQNNFHNPMF